MEALKTCPFCGKEAVQQRSEMRETEYKGHRAQLPLHYLVCEACGADFGSAHEAKLTRRATLAWRKQIDGLLPGCDIAALRKRYGLTQAQATTLFGGGSVAFSKYENDEVMQSDAMDALLRLVADDARAFETLVHEKGMGGEIRGQGDEPVIRQAAHHSERKATDRTALYEPRQFRLTEEERAKKGKKP